MEALKWKQTSPGRFERSLDELESLFLAWGAVSSSSGRECWRMTACVDFKYHGADVVEAFRKAWTAIRFIYPSIATTVEDGKLCYTVADQAELQYWLNETFKIADGPAMELYPTLPPASRPTLYLLPKHNQLVIQVSHFRCDGAGTYKVLNTLFENIDIESKIVFGDEAQRLSLPFQYVARALEPTERDLADMGKVMESVMEAQPTIGLPPIRADQPPGPSRRRHLSLSQDETTALGKLAKSSGWTSTQIIHAAVIHATKRLSGTNGSYVQMFPINLRSRVKDIVDEPVRMMVFGSLMAIRPSSFNDTLSQLKAVYDSCNVNNFRPGMVPTFARTVLPMLQQPPPVLATTPILSAIGPLDSVLKFEYGTITVEDTWGTVDVMTGEPALHAWFWKNALQLGVAYNTTYNTEAQIDEFLATVKELLFSGLEPRAVSRL
jgi:hypothetical protein